MDTSVGFWVRNFSNIALDFPNTTAVILGRLLKARWRRRYMFAQWIEPVPRTETVALC